MVTIDEYSKIVSDIYTANWPAALTRIGTVLNATGCAIYVGQGANRSILSDAVPTEARRSYIDYFHNQDFILDAIDNSPCGVIRSGAALTACKPHSEFENDFMRPHCMDDGLFVRLAAGRAPALFFAVAPKTRTSFETAQRVEFVTALIRHLEQSLLAQEHVSLLDRTSGELTDVIDTVAQGLLVVRNGGEIMHLNRSARAMLQAGDGLEIRSNRIKATRPTIEDQLHSIIAAALLTGRAGPPTGGSIACSRPTGKRPYIIHVLPLSAPGTDSTTATALVIIIDPAREAVPPKSLLRQIFGLTNAEADVALLVMRGEGLTPVSTELALSRATVNTHLQHIFDKTGTHRQAELVRLLLQSSTPSTLLGGTGYIDHST